MPFSHPQLNLLGSMIAMSTSAADLTNTCACAQAVQFTHIFSRWIFISDRDGIINLHQGPTSHQAADIDDIDGDTRQRTRRPSRLTDKKR